MAPYHLYTTSVEFFDAHSGQIISGTSRTSIILPYVDPMEDPPVIRLLYPAAKDDSDYPSVQGETAVLEAQTVDLAKVRVGQAVVILVNNGVAGFFGRMNHVRTTMDFPEESYRRMCPPIMPQLAAAAIVTADGRELVALSDFTLFWAGSLAPEELAALPSLRPIPDDGTLSVLYPAPTFWTQAARPAPCFVLGDGSYGAQDLGLPVMGFMAQKHPEGSALLSTPPFPLSSLSPCPTLGIHREM